LVGPGGWLCPKLESFWGNSVGTFHYFPWWLTLVGNKGVGFSPIILGFWGTLGYNSNGGLKGGGFEIIEAQLWGK